MASMKRKRDIDDASSKPASKRPREEKPAPHKSIRSGGKENAEARETKKKAASSSILVKEQPAFPRGGAGILTPIERKQINAKAVRDAAAEQNGEALFDTSDGQENVTSDGEIPGDGTPQPQSKKLKKRNAKRFKDDSGKPRPTKVGGLSYKRIIVGSLILGQVTAISARDLTIALPNNLVGYVPLSAVSKQFSKRIQDLLDDDASSDDNGEYEKNQLSLQSYFRIGQCLRVCVTSTGQDDDIPAPQSRRRLELSIEPGSVNIGLSRAILTTGTVVQVAVASVEDHGLVTDLDLENEQIRGFIPSTSLPAWMPLSQIKEGAVLLCQTTQAGSNSKVVKLSVDLGKQTVLKNASSVNAFMPGTLTEILITEVQDAAAVGKIMGMVNATVDLVHSGAYQDKEAFDRLFRTGKKVKGRIICTFPMSEETTVGFSVLENLLSLDSEIVRRQTSPNLLSCIVSDASIIRVEPGLGVYLDLGSGNYGFAHMSRLSDERVESIAEMNGPFKLRSQHTARVLEFNPLDNLYIVSLQESVINQPFLRIEDVPIGEVVKGTIAKALIGPAGIKGLIVTIADGITGLVPEKHLSDAVLQNPEKKFREGGTVKARVLSTNPSRRQIRLTLKKTLVNSDSKLWKAFEDIDVGDSSFGTLVKVDLKGALVQFYGNVKGFLPVSEMSEAYIKDAREHFRVGQVVTVNVISVDPDQQRLTLSCRDSKALSRSAESLLSSVKPGSFVTGVVFEKSQDDIQLRLEGTDAIARLTVDHVSDGSLRKRQSVLDKIRVGQKLEEILVLDVQARRRLVILCNRPSLAKAAKEGRLLTGFESLESGAKYTGYVSNITSDGVFVSFASRITGMIIPRNVLPGNEGKEDYGMSRLQVLTATVTSIDYKGASPRFWLTLKDTPTQKLVADHEQQTSTYLHRSLSDAVDSTLATEAELVLNKTTKARIVSVKDTQLNVEIAKDVQGRIDVSEIFDGWEDIKDRKRPLRHFNQKQVLNVKVLGTHDTRNHRFLPLTHRTGKNTVYELTAKPSAVLGSNLGCTEYRDLQVGSSWVAFVNNIGSDCLWVNISPSVRGRVKAVDVSDDLSLASNLSANFPLGSALRVRVVAVDEEKGWLDLTARTGDLSTNLTMQDISKGMILPGRVTKVSDRQIVVQLSESLVGAVDLIDMADDYKQANPANHQKNDIVRVCIVRVDAPNKKVSLSLRPSRVLSSSITVTDPEITSIEQLHVNDVYSGFIRNIDDKGIFVTLGHGITAFVRVSHLSDPYLKEWKDNFQRDQLVKGKLINVDQSSGHVQMSLKESVINSHYTPPVVFGDLKEGDIVTGKVVKVQDFGVFILVDNSENVRGLCHRSEIAEQSVEDATKLFSEGDVVKAKVLKVDVRQKRINFGMKTAYFSDNVDEDTGVSDDLSMDGELDSSGSDPDEGVLIGDTAIGNLGSQETPLNEEGEDFSEQDITEDDEESVEPEKEIGTGLKVGGFDWYGMSTKTSSSGRVNTMPDSDLGTAIDRSKARKKRAEIQVDRTGELDAHGPQSVDDYERLLLGESDSSLLWLQYMAFHLELGDVDQARQIGERALKSIGFGQDTEKMNVWVAMLNLENAYGDEETTEAMFKRACEYNDPQDMHSRLTSIYIQSGKKAQADEMFQRMLKKFTQDPKTWTNYGTFLFDTIGDADRARDVLPRALQVLPKFTHLDVTSKFAQLEFKSPAGMPERGRTIFEGLISSFPKRIDLYNVLLDLEVKLGDGEKIRAMFERIFSGRLKPKQAKYFFKRWLAFEEKEGDERKIEEVKARAATWIRNAGKIESS